MHQKKGPFCIMIKVFLSPDHRGVSNEQNKGSSKCNGLEGNEGDRLQLEFRKSTLQDGIRASYHSRMQGCCINMVNFQNFYFSVIDTKKLRMTAYILDITHNIQRSARVQLMILLSSINKIQASPTVYSQLKATKENIIKSICK